MVSDNTDLNGDGERGQIAETKNPYINQVANQKKKKKVYNVIVCEVDSDCMMKPFKPIFIYKYKKQQSKKDLSSQNRSGKKDSGDIFNSSDDNIDDDYDDDDEMDELITPKDRVDIYQCKRLRIDAICLSNVRHADEIKQFKQEELEKKNTVRIIAKIQTPEGKSKYIL